MFTLRPDASKIALAALVAFCRQNGIDMIDCQQNTRHLASLGAREMPRENLLKHVQAVADLAPPAWHFDVSWWEKLVTPEQVDA